MGIQLIILLDILIKLRKKMGKFILHGKQTLIKLDFNKYKAAVNVPENSLDETRKLSSVEKNLTNNGLKREKNKERGI